MPPPSQNAAMPANDSGEAELVDRLRYAAMGKRANQKNLRSAQMVFDSGVDVGKRTRLLAHLAAAQPPRRSSFTLKGAGSWLPIPMGILAVMALGAALSQKVSRKSEAPSPSTPTLQASEPAPGSHPLPTQNSDSPVSPDATQPRPPGNSDITRQ